MVVGTVTDSLFPFPAWEHANSVKGPPHAPESTIKPGFAPAAVASVMVTVVEFDVATKLKKPSTKFVPQLGSETKLSANVEGTVYAVFTQAAFTGNVFAGNVAFAQRSACENVVNEIVNNTIPSSKDVFILFTI